MSEAMKNMLSFLCGAGGLALIEWAREAWKHRVERRERKEDRQEEKAQKTEELTRSVNEFRKEQGEQGLQLDALRGAMKCVLLDRIIYLGQKYIEAGEVDFDDRKRLRDMHTSYHRGLGGNGDADAIMKAVDALPLKNSKKT